MVPSLAPCIERATHKIINTHIDQLSQRMGNVHKAMDIQFRYFEILSSLTTKVSLISQISFLIRSSESQINRIDELNCRCKVKASLKAFA